MTPSIGCLLWSSVYECQRVECAFTYPVRTECGMFVMCCMRVYGWCRWGVGWVLGPGSGRGGVMFV